jgi:hypothetical protein
MTRYVIIQTEDGPRVAIVEEENRTFSDGETLLTDPSLPDAVRNGELGQVFDEQGVLVL